MKSSPLLLLPFLGCLLTFAETPPPAPAPPGAVGAAAPGGTGFPPEVRTVLQKHCFACHGEKKQKGDVRLDTLSIDFLKDAAAAETWHDALNSVSKGEMPPEKEPRPTDEERALLTGWLRKNLGAAAAAGAGVQEGTVLRRLNKAEYRFTLTDLLGLPGDYGRNLPADPLSKDGFANNGADLGMSSLQTEICLESARSALAAVLVEGAAPPATASRLVTKSEKIRKRLSSGEGNVLDRAGLFVARFSEKSDPGVIPAEGAFTIRVKARAELKPGQAPPVLRATYGPNTDSGGDVGSRISITDPETRAYDFTGRVRDYPTPGRETKDTALTPEPGSQGQTVMLENALEDGKGISPMEYRRTVAPIPPTRHDPNFPAIIIESVQLLGNEDRQWPPAPHRSILFAAADEGTPAYAREVLRRFMSRAWRRPATGPELEKYHAHFLKFRQQQFSFVAAMRETLAVVLTSPNFLYLAEPRLKKDGSQPLNDYETATRLSYYLWSSMPDETLFSLAAKGTLKQPEVLAAQARRLMADPKFQRFIGQFTTQWLALDGLEQVAVNPQYYPNFRDKLKEDMRQETQLYFSEILRTGGSALQFLDSDWTMLNAPLARHYGLTGPKSQAFERVSLEGTSRPGGLLGQASMLLSNSNGEDSSPIKRAVWIRDRLLDDPPPPPPPNVPALPAQDPDFARRSIRSQLEIHRKDPACADCHRSIDPWGIALDHYDAVGLWRDVIRRPAPAPAPAPATAAAQQSEEKPEDGPSNTPKKRKKAGKPQADAMEFDEVPVDSHDVLPGGVQLTGIESVKAYLMRDKKDQFSRALVTKMLTYALGRSLRFSDEPAVEQLTRGFIASGCRLSTLITDIAVCAPFSHP